MLTSENRVVPKLDFTTNIYRQFFNELSQSWTKLREAKMEVIVIEEHFVPQSSADRSFINDLTPDRRYPLP